MNTDKEGPASVNGGHPNGEVPKTSIETATTDIESGPTGRRRRSEELFCEQQETNYRRTDRMFAGLMVFQWVAGIIAAIWISPKTWSGTQSQIHLHVWAAAFIGGAITSLPVFLAVKFPGQARTRHAIAVGQMLTSALLIHLSGGRVETHFHVTTS